MTTMPGSLDNEPEPSFRSDSPVKMPSKQALDQYIDLKIAQYNDSGDDDEALWARYTEDFDAWNEQFFQTANRTKVVKLRTCLREHGVRVEMDGRKARMAVALVQVVQEEEPSD